MDMGKLGTLCLAGLAAATTLLAGDRDAVSYEQFMKYSVQERKKLFTELSAERKADLMLTQGRRCLEAYDAKLTPKQKALISESLGLVGPDMYPGADLAPGKEAREAKKAKVQQLLGQLKETKLDPFYMEQCFSLNGTVPR